MAITAPRAAAPATPRVSPVASYYLLASSTALLVLVGLAVMLSSSSVGSLRSEGDPYADFRAQLAYLAVGVVLLMLASRIPIAALKRSVPAVLAVAVVLLVLVAASPLGVAEGGNRNWLAIGSFSAQPSEGAKLALALYLGRALAVRRGTMTTFGTALAPVGLVAGGVVGLVLLGRDLGTSLVMLVLIAAAYWTAGVPARLFATGSIGVLAIVALLVATRDSVSSRVAAWLSPDCDAAGACFQSTHGTWALASGGVWGLGPGLSREKWSYLPKADNDFIYAILGEEFGLVGTLFVLVALAMIIVAVNRIVQRHRDPFVQISAAAIGAWVVGQASLNIAVVLGLAPVTGVPLPLVSAGGSSLIMSLVGIGILLSFARREPGALEALAARPTLARRSLTVLGKSRG